MREIAKNSRGLLAQEAGQDVVEYSLLLAFVVLASAALFLLSADNIAVIWNTTNSNLVKAQEAIR